jgi:hypothetical protein
MTELTLSLKTLSDVEASDKINLRSFFLSRAKELIAIVTILKLPVNLGSRIIK